MFAKLRSRVRISKRKFHSSNDGNESMLSGCLASIGGVGAIIWAMENSLENDLSTWPAVTYMIGSGGLGGTGGYYIGQGLIFISTTIGIGLPVFFVVVCVITVVCIRTSYNMK